ncbi:MAG TPA: hypothetical protein VM345_11515 [Acidimicrobiales bacterium]|nr:hypothetical protein [Acidimicrobiales bacterium]
MTRVRAVALLVVAWATLSLLVAAAPSSAASPSITKVGWWSRNPTSSAPEDAFNVANAPDGPVSVGAVEISGSGSVSSAVLILEEAGGIQNESAKLQVCPTPNAWNAGGPQPFGEAPKAECDQGKVELTRNGASSTWAADVAPLLGDLSRSGRVSLMVVPGGAAAVPVGFDVRFAKVTLSATSSSAPDTSASDTPTTTGGFSGSSGNNVSDSPDSSSGASFEAPATIAPAVPTTADGIAGVQPSPLDGAGAADTASDGSGAGAAAASPDQLAAVPTQASAGVTTGTGNATLQAIFFVAVALLAGAGAGGGRWFLRERYSSR